MPAYPLIALATIVAAFIISAGGTVLVRRAAVAAKLVSKVAEDRFGKQPTPLGGGVAIMAAIALPTLLAAALAQYWAATGAPGWLPLEVAAHVEGAASRVPMALIVLGGALVLCLVGLIDDRWNLGPWLKLIGQALVAAAVVWFADIRILTVLGEPLSVAVSVLWMLVIINAVNFMDNMDGLAAAVTLVASCALLAAAAGLGQLFVSAWLCLLIGGVLGFLPFNAPPARIYMGDAGSLVLGFFLAAGSMLTTYYDPTVIADRPAYTVLSPLIVLAVPLYDFVSVVILRLRAGVSPFRGDTRHFSHRLVRRGMTVRAAVLTIGLCTAVTGIAAVLLPHVSDWAAMLLAGQTLGVLCIIALLESAGEAS
ncbi:MAG: undecaprenyl/decaprenyl-phosphate alpha-N-acetylglucosaminyl 1-phosphate transferase [Planctomycetes bacterium]|nr:undecaprenyl/decaprenyl-phosphate alpha-N-acetylglucosaminyl 1-phosphate transferase [Planctomycetota bacterium]